MAWLLKPLHVEFFVGKTQVGKEGFQEAFQATSCQEGFDTYV